MRILINKFTFGLIGKLLGWSVEPRLQVLFHKAALQHGAHGIMRANNKDLRLEGALIRFVFPGMSQPPALSLEFHNKIWEEAMLQGWEPLELHSYGFVLKSQGGNLPLQNLVAAQHRSVEANRVRSNYPLPEKTRAIADADMKASLRQTQQVETRREGYMTFPQTETEQH